jgi:hypothetical protein
VSLYTDLVEAGIEVSNWQSDLYFPVSYESMEILAKYPNQSRSIFKSNIDGRPTVEAPFAFDPYWESKVVDTASTK